MKIYLTLGSHKIRLLLIMTLLAIFLTSLYLPLILGGGIIADDWGDISQTLNCANFFECYLSWFPLFSNRPLAPLPITTATLLFKTNFSWYLILNTTIYLLSLFIIGNLLRRILGTFPALIFIILGSIPFIGMPIVISPINQLTATFSLLYWAISLHCLFIYLQKSSKLVYALTYILLLLSLLTYEITLPLLIFSALFPFIIKDKKERFSYFYYFLNYLLPIIVVLLIAICWQKILAPLFFSAVYSRLAFDPSNISIFFLGWLNVFSLQIPRLFLKVNFKEHIYNFFPVLILIISFIYAYYVFPIIKTQISINRRFFLISFICFISCSSIFILSGNIAESWSYGARALSSTWIALSILAASIWTILPRFNSIKLIGILVFAGYSSISFGIQRDNYIKSWKMQKLILADVLQQTKEQNVSRGATIIGNVPRILPNDFNKELVFSEPWDFGAALHILSNQAIEGGAVLDTRRGEFRNLKIKDSILYIDHWWKTPFTNLWFYDFDPLTNLGKLIKADSQDQAEKYLVSIGLLGELGKSSFLGSNRLIPLNINWQNQSSYLVKGWSEKEKWGGIWSNGKESEIRLPLPKDGSKKLVIQCQAFVNSKHPAQKVEIFINNSLIKTVSLVNFNENTIEIDVPQSAFSLPFLKIDFKFESAISPKDLAINNDERKLAIGIKSIMYF